jgi:hypothetical protein
MQDDAIVSPSMRREGFSCERLGRRVECGAVEGDRLADERLVAVELNPPEQMVRQIPSASTPASSATHTDALSRICGSSGHDAK